jgi:type VI secretion system secreted protein Hcp
MAQVDYFLKLDGIDGESQDDKHKNEIEIESFSWGATNSGTAGRGSGSGAGKVQHQDLVINKSLDKASPNLYINCCTGTHIKTATLTARKAGGGQQEYLKITLEEVLISSYQHSGANGSGTVPSEQVTLNFSKMELSYKEQKPDGSLGAEAKQKYDFAANKKV